MARGRGRGGGGGSRGGRGARPAKGKSPGGGRPQTTGDKDDDMMNDEVDRYYKQKEKLSLNAADGSDDDSALDEDAAVYDVSDADDSSDDEDALDEDIERGGHIGQMAKTAKALGARLKQQRAEFDDEEEEEEEGDGRDRLWGANKKTYHGADNVDYEDDDDEDAAQEEEAEAVRLQREAAADLRPEDYADGLDLGGEESSSEEDEDEEEQTMGQAAAKGKAGVEVERVEKDLASLGDEAQRAAIQRDAPELQALLAELRHNLAEVRGRIGPLIKEVRAGQLATAEGVSYLEAKHMLLLSYCTNIVFYLLLKAEGRPVRTHPVIGRLLQIRAYLEKLRPIDKKLQYQMEKLLRAAQQVQAAGADGGAADPLSFGPKPDQLLPKVSVPQDDGGVHGGGGGGGAGHGGGDGSGLYRPPRNLATSMEDDPDRRRSAKERRAERDGRGRAGRSALVAELAREVEGAPEELTAGGGASGMDTSGGKRQLRQLEARAAVEEDLMMRVPLSKEQRKALKSQQRAGMSGKALTDDFADEVADLVRSAQGLEAPGNDGIDDIYKRSAVSQKYGGDLFHGLKGRSGDDDLPQREALHERRAKYDSVKARQSALDDSDGEVQPGGSKRPRAPPRELDETYVAAAEAAAAKKRARKDTYKIPDLAPPLPDEPADGARGINTAIEKNRGLTPHRNKELKNPRKKHRIKFAEANVRRAGQVQLMREKSAGYGGEATGIKSKVTKSRRF